MSFDYELPDGWSWKTIEEVQESPKGATITGPFGSSIGKKFFVEKGVPVIRGNNLSLGMTPFIDDGFVYVSEEKADELKRYKSIADDLLFTAAGTIGQVGIIPKKSKYDEYIISNKQLRARLDTTVVDPTYAYYWFSSKPMVEYIKRQDTGSTIPLINLGVLRSLPLPVPPLDVQVRIRKILKSFDKKIWINTETNQTLEQMAQAIFKSWFVDFDPVKAKMNGEQPEGMDAATASLFPEKLVESELGLIPEGWSVQTIKSLSEKISKGTTPSKKDLASATDEPSIRFIKVKDIDDQGEILRGKLETIPESIHMSKLKRSILERDDILFSIAGTIGRVAIVDQDLDNVNTNQAVAFVRLKDKQTYLPLVYMSMRESRLQQKAISSIVQGVQANLSLANVGDMEVIVPPKDILNLWNKHYSSILQMIKNNFGQSRQLAVLRDTLLPKLLSGDIELETK